MEVDLIPVPASPWLHTRRPVGHPPTTRELVGRYNDLAQLFSVVSLSVAVHQWRQVWGLASHRHMHYMERHKTLIMYLCYSKLRLLYNELTKSETHAVM